MSYFTERESEFAEFAKDDNYGTTLRYNGLTAVCLSTSAATRREMKQTNFQPEVKTTFDILRTEWTRLGLALQTTIESPADATAVQYQISSYNDDSNEPVIQFGAVLLK